MNITFAGNPAGRDSGVDLLFARTETSPASGVGIRPWSVPMITTESHNAISPSIRTAPFGPSYTALVRRI